MTESDSGVDTGSESNESNCMSVGSPSRSDDDKDINDFVQKIEPLYRSGLFTVKNLHESSMYEASCSYGFSDYRQQEQVRKMKSQTQGNSSRRWTISLLPRGPKRMMAERRLRTAANLNVLHVVRRLLDEHIDPNCSDARQRTALHFAAAGGHLEIATLLIARGADPNQRDSVGNTPLHLAVCTSQIGMVTLLLKSGTDIHALDNCGRTPFHLAEAKLKLLQRNMKFSSTVLKSEVIGVMEMMNVYLQMSGRGNQTGFINTISNRIHQHQTKEEVDIDVKDLLSNLSHLSLQPT